MNTERMESSYSYNRADMKPRALSFRVSPAKHIATLEHKAVYTEVGTQKSAKYSETHFHASEHLSRDGDKSSLPPPIPARRSKQQRVSEPVLYPTMPSMESVYTTEYTEVRSFLIYFKKECFTLEISRFYPIRRFSYLNLAAYLYILNIPIAWKRLI